ncbi:MAG: hypothetical protein CVT98_02585 [Bacteroidetes bacterium HGW-Bacteroidetes-15]|nr:MAG: hypothetical protein CVT98_02585 [Bacteroidetes bacterium HGW-Bacteroidetes-15]
MRKKITTIFVVASLLFAFGCGSKEKKAEKEYSSTFTPMEIVIPDELKDNPEAVEYINNMAKATDAYALAVEKFAAEVYKMGFKEGEELSTMQKIKLMTILAEHFEGIAKSSEPMLKYFEESNFMLNEFNETEIAAFAVVMDRFQARMEELEKKYESLSLVADN